MINIDAWPAIVKLLLIVVPFAISMVGVAMNVHITLSRDYHTVCSAITTNPYLESLKVAWGRSSFKWRFYLVCAVGGVVIFPGFALRRGKLNVDELKAFPPRLKRKLEVSFWLTAVGFFFMAITTLAIEFSRMN